ncbi:peptidoglycan DD-metalloendopeptidase family protein [Mastigocoleus sp. MO_188.B34]|uniref:peptidoglycan DD-metalloendopeptidase family protein n=1 Tax=Mastigocoleus sp. MO_188.B34 TaxID=3036635 RepID=UPI00263823DB|nr:peptidoglycan DD-metalloendopeptidase family protein [Mastigocoleus sp. MO_188.B34]MDJ0694943.1 peptidoglycan DD-metalloendopeptidase family protein [Mastigocoleus sp. MO_188.B34]
MKRALKKRANAVVENTVSDDVSMGQIEELDNSKACRRARTKAAMIGLAISMGATSLLVTRQSDQALAAESVGSQKAASSLPAASENDVNFAPRKTSEYGVFSNVSVPDNPQTVDIKAIPEWKGLGTKGQIAALKSAKLPLPKVVSSQSAVKNAASLKETLKTAKQQTKAQKGLAGEQTVSSSSRPQTIVPTTNLDGNVNAQLKAQQEFAIQRLQEKSNNLRASLAKLRSGGTKSPSAISHNSVKSSNSTEKSVNSVARSGRQISDNVKASEQAKSIKRFNPGVVANIPALPGVVTPAENQPYSVKSGDTLGEIAQSYGTSVTELARVNKLNDPDKLQVNQQLVIPGQQDRITSSVTTIAFNPNFKLNGYDHGGKNKASTLASSEIGVDPKSTIGSELFSSTNQSSTGEAAYGMGGEATPLVFAEMRLARVKAASDKNPKYNQRLRSLKAEIERLRAKYRAQKSREGKASEVEAVTLPQNKNASTSRRSIKQNNNVSVPIAVPTAGSSTLATQNNGAVPIPVPQPKSVSSIYGSRYNSQFIQRNNSVVTPRTNNLSTPLPPLAAAGRYLPRPIENIQPKSKGYIWPAKGVLTSGYGPRWGRMHRGIDIAAPTGTPIHAAAAGVVKKAGWNRGGYGYLVDIRHPDGTITRYAHNSKLLVKKGQQVQQGQKISLMGSTGFSTGPHLHFEIRPNGRATNPMAFLPPKKR